MQADRSTGRSQGGLGIGLTLAKNLVELHGGRITAASNGPGQGSEFIVQLPISSAKSREPSSQAPSDRARPLLIAECWSWTTIETLPKRWACYLRSWERTFTWRTTGPRPWRQSKRTARTSSYWTSGCRAWTASRSRAAHPRKSQLRRRLLIALTGWGQTEDRDRTRGRLRPSPGEARRHHRIAIAAGDGGEVRMSLERGRSVAGSRCSDEACQPSIHCFDRSFSPNRDSESR